VKALVDKFEEFHGNIITKSVSRDSVASTAMLPGSMMTLSPSRSEPFFFRESPTAYNGGKPKSQSPIRVSPDSKNFKETNEYLILENVKLTKLVKKLETKTQERKKNLKELFKLVTEKDNELKQMKAKAKIESSLYMVKVEEIFKLAEEKLKEKYLTLQNNLIQKEAKLQNIESEVSRIFTHRGFTQGSHRSIPTNGNLEFQDLLVDYKRKSTYFHLYYFHPS